MSLFLAVVENAQASSAGITGQSTAGCTASFCHGDPANGFPAGSFNYTGTVQRFSGSWLTSGTTIDSGAGLTIRFFLNNNATSAAAGGFNMSATGGTLATSSGAIDEGFVGSGELTHTAPLAVGGGGDVNFTGITWDTSTSESGNFTIRACGQPVNLLDGNSGDGPFSCDTMDVTVRPVITGWSGTTTYNENTQNGAYLAVDSVISLNSSDNLNRVESNITNPLTGDALGCPSPAVAGISCSGTGTTSLTMTGTASRASYDTAIQGIRFRNTSENPSTNLRSVRVRVRDSSNVYSSYVTKSVDVNPEDDAPTISGVDGALSYNEADPAAVVESTIILGDVDSTSFNRAEVEISTACQLAEDRLEANLTVCASNSLTCTQTTNCAVTVTGTQPIANYDAVLQAITYRNISNNPVTTARTVRYRVRDTTNVYSLYDSKTINVVSISFPPEIAGVDNVLAYAENDAASIIDGAISISDPDSTNLNSAEVDISGNCELATDRLEADAAVCSANGITCSQNGNCGLILSDNQPIANYEAVLEAITFRSVSENPSTSARTVRYRVFDEGNTVSADVTTTLSVTRTNDLPMLAPIGNQNAFEDTPADPFTFQYDAVATDQDVDDDINDGSLATGGSGTLTYSLMNAPGGMTISNDNANPGRITWMPPITGFPATDYGPITVQVVDGDNVPVSQTFNVTVSPPDGDGDGFENYNDFCPTTFSLTNLDFDGDGTAGSDGVPADILTDFTGGDDCDADDDNDGMPDDFEDDNSLDKFNDADAGLDADGDGVTNLQEYLNGTNPNLGNLTIDATGYLTPYDLVAPEPTSIHSLATAVTPEFYATGLTPVSDDPFGPYRPGNNTIEWVPSNADFADLRGVPGLVANPPIQTFLVRPLASFAVNQQAEENSAVTVTVRLNGDSPSWQVLPPASPAPATVNYSVSGTAGNPADHDAVSGSLQFNPGEYRKDITFNIAPDGVTDPNETIVFTLTSATNAVIGSKKTHTVTIVEDNVAPSADLRFNQAGVAVSSVYTDNGAITIDAVATDVNSAQVPSLSYDWSGTSNALVPPAVTNMPSWTPTPAVPLAGNYRIDVVVTDSGGKSTRVSRVLNVSGDTPPDVAANLADADGDGIPLFLDNIDDSNLVPDQTVDLNESMLLQTEPGLTLRRGGTSQASGRFGALLNDSDIKRFGSVNGNAPTTPDDDFEHIGGIYDFEIHGLVAGSSARVVIPLQSSIPRDAHYRKFNPATGWGDFIVDDNNRIASAAGESGACPEPGSSAYRSGLNDLDNCIQLTIQDGGPNDTDNRVNGIINDPAAVGVALTEPDGFDEVEEGSGGGRVSLLLLAILSALGGFAYRRRRPRGAGID